MTTNIKIGVTEAGDAALDYSWLDKIDSCDGVILITKNLTDKLIEEILKHQNKIILHATCTGMGGTIIEPNVPTYTRQLEQVKKLMATGFPEERIIVRIDPIVPTEKGLQTAQKVIDTSPIKHFRISILDAYPHVRKRFIDYGVQLPYGDYFQPSTSQIANMQKWLANQVGCSFETCAEPRLANTPNVITRGCVSERDLKLLGLPVNGNYLTGLQRKNCLCLSCKTELLSHKTPCSHGCLYCYWK